MTLTTVGDLVNALLERQILEPGQLDEVIREYQPKFEDPRALAQKLADLGWLSAFQVERLLRDGGKDLVLGPYRLLEQLGEGGMGQVFKARHQRLDRMVALKVIRQEHRSQDPEAIRRFQREARAAAQLSHPNIVVLYDADQIDNTYFIAMEYVDGTDLSRMVKEKGSLPVAQACDYVRQAALGLQHAHERGLVHRDVKPSNLLVARVQTTAVEARGLSGMIPRPVLPGEESGEAASAAAAPASVTVTDQIKILDLGLARLTHAADSQATNSSLTREGSVMGTPDYIAPEQARNAHRVDIRADIYSLGCTLYYLLSGRPPFPEGSVIEKLLMHQLDEPAPIEALRPQVSADLPLALRKMMAKRPEDRYQTPAEVAQAMALFTALSESTAAGPAAAGVESTAATAIVSVTPTTTPPEELSIASAARPTPERVSLPPRESGATLAPRRPEPELPPGVEAAKHIAVLKGHGGCVLALAFGLDRNTLAAATIKGDVHLWDFGGSKPNRRDVLDVPLELVSSLAFSPDIKVLATGSGGWDGSILLWDLSEQKLKEKAAVLTHKAPIGAMCFSPDGKLLATAADDKTVRLIDVTATQPKERAVLKGHTDAVKFVVFSPDGKFLASAGQDSTIRLWQPGRLWWSERDLLEGHGGQVNSLAFAPDGQLLASASQDQSVRLWDLSEAKAKQRAVFTGHSGVVRLVQFARDGLSLTSVDSDGLVIQWETASGERQQQWMLPRMLIYSFAFTFDGRYLAVGTNDGNVVVYRLGSKKGSTSPEKAPS